MKKQRKVEKDNRGVAIYARKSRITNKVDMINTVHIHAIDNVKRGGVV